MSVFLSRTFGKTGEHIGNMVVLDMLDNVVCFRDVVDDLVDSLPGASIALAGHEAPGAVSDLLVLVGSDFDKSKASAIRHAILRSGRRARFVCLYSTVSRQTVLFRRSCWPFWRGRRLLETALHLVALRLRWFVGLPDHLL